jgi:hypothetical protein
MKIATITKLLAAAALLSAPMIAQAQGAKREGAKLGSSEMLAFGGLFAALAAVAAAAGGGALAADEDPASA